MFSRRGTTDLFVGVARDQSIDRGCARVRARQRAPLAITPASEGAGRASTRMRAPIDDVGARPAVLARGGAFNVTGTVHHIDGGQRIVPGALPGGRE